MAAKSLQLYRPATNETVNNHMIVPSAACEQNLVQLRAAFRMHPPKGAWPWTTRAHPIIDFKDVVDGQRILVCESYFEVMRAAEQGISIVMYDNGNASVGTSNSLPSLTSCAKWHFSNIYDITCHLNSILYHVECHTNTI
jgi:hypothetical protein